LDPSPRRGAKHSVSETARAFFAIPPWLARTKERTFAIIELAAQTCVLGYRRISPRSLSMYRVFARVLRNVCPLITSSLTSYSCCSFKILFVSGIKEMRGKSTPRRSLMRHSFLTSPRNSVIAPLSLNRLRQSENCKPQSVKRSDLNALSGFQRSFDPRIPGALAREWQPVVFRSSFVKAATMRKISTVSRARHVPEHSMETLIYTLVLSRLDGHRKARSRLRGRR